MPHVRSAQGYGRQVIDGNVDIFERSWINVDITKPIVAGLIAQGKVIVLDSVPAPTPPANDGGYLATDAEVSAAIQAAVAAEVTARTAAIAAAQNTGPQGPQGPAGPIGPNPPYGTLANRPTVAAAGDKGLYFATDDNGGTLYQVQAGAWTVIGLRGLELGYSEWLANMDFGPGQAALPIPAMTVTSRGRPYIVHVHLPSVIKLTANNWVWMQLANQALTTQYADRKVWLAIGGDLVQNGNAEVDMFYRRSDPVGTAITFVVAGQCGSNTARVESSASSPAFMRANEC